MAEQLEREQPHWQIWQQLPLHPQPAALESLTSYIMRVAQANGLQTSAEFVAAAGTGYGWQTLRSFPDGSITSVLGLTTLTGCTQTNLEAMTFLPFGRHFGRANSTRTLRRFLQSSLAPYLRYCPVCLAERGFPYYRLPWRFLILSGCLTHHCQFLDHCGHCGARIPLLPDHPDLSACPTCRWDLRTCQPSFLSVDEERLLPHRTSDLLFLLRSLIQTQEENPRVVVGKCYSFIRQQRGLSLQEVISLTELNPQILSEIEYAGASKKATFLDYVQYTDLLGTSLEELFSTVLPITPLEEDALLIRVDETIQLLRNQGRPIQSGSIGKQIGVSVTVLKDYPRINSALEALHLQRKRAYAQQKPRREEELLQRVEHAVEQLETFNLPVTQNRIAQTVGMSYQALRTYPRVEARLVQIVSQHYQQPFKS